jgi:transcriptional regulator with XRE-family HTH domain
VFVTISECIRELRTAAGESQQAFATNLGISIRALANYEAGQREPGIRTVGALFRVADYVRRVDLADFLFDQIREALGFDLVTFPETKERESCGYLLLKLNNQKQVDDAIQLVQKRRGRVREPKLRNTMDKMLSGRRGLRDDRGGQK